MMTYQSIRKNPPRSWTPKQSTAQTTQCGKHIFSQMLVQYEHFVNKVNAVLTLLEPLHPKRICYNQLTDHWKTNFKRASHDYLRRVFEVQPSYQLNIS